MEKFPLKAVSVIEALAKSLRDRVLSGELVPDMPLPEQRLAMQYGVARPTIRAAIQQLTLTGLLRREANRSAFVPRLSEADIRDLFRARKLLEIEVVRILTTRRFCPSRAQQALRRLETLGAQPRWNEVVDIDLDIHLALVEASGSSHIARLYELLADEIRLCIAQLKPAYDASAALLAREHRELLAAIEHGDVERATDVMEQHLDEAVQDLVRTGPNSKGTRAALTAKAATRQSAAQRTGAAARRLVAARRV